MKAAGQHLDGNVAAHPRIAPAVHLALSSSPSSYGPRRVPIGTRDACDSASTVKGRLTGKSEPIGRLEIDGRSNARPVDVIGYFSTVTVTGC